MTEARSPNIARLATASIVGTTFEYFDFALYNTLAALLLNCLFFPDFDPLAGAMLSFSTFAVGTALNALAMPFFGALSDRFGRRAVGCTGAILAAIWVFVLFPLFDSKLPGLIVLALSVGLFIHAMLYGTQSAFITEQFPTRVRYAGSSLAYTSAGVVGGGIAPLVLASLLKWTQSTIYLSLYAAACLALTAAVLVFTVERSQSKLE